MRAENIRYSRSEAQRWRPADGSPMVKCATPGCPAYVHRAFVKGEHCDQCRRNRGGYVSRQRRGRPARSRRVGDTGTWPRQARAYRGQVLASQ